MSVVQMKKLMVCAMRENRKAVLEKLQRLGVMEIIPYSGDAVMDFIDTTSDAMTFDRNADQASEAIAILDRYSPEKKGLFESLNGKDHVADGDLTHAASDYKQIMKDVGRILDSEKAIAQDKADISKLEIRIAQLDPWKKMEVPFHFRGTSRTGTVIGSIPEKLDETGLRTFLAERLPDFDAYELDIVYSSEEMTCFGILCFKEDIPELENVLREKGFSQPSGAGKQISRKEIEECGRRITSLKSDIAAKETFIRESSGKRYDFKLVSDYFRIRSQKYEFLSKIPETGNAFFIEGYVPASAAERVKDILEREYDAYVAAEDLAEDEEGPVLLENNRFSSMVEGTTASFGLPAKGEIDPTCIMSVFFIFFFGLMLSDAAYGLILSLACGIVLLKCPRMEKGMKSLIRIFFWGGISTLFWGILFGGYFGDVIEVVARNFFGKDVTVPALWFVPLKDPMRLLIWSMIFGIIHLFTGLGIKGYMKLKAGETASFIFDVLSWFVLLIGLILMLVPSKLFSGISGTSIVFPDWLNLLAKLMAIAGAATIVLMSARDNKNFGLRVALGLYDLYGVSGWLSDVLSYSRLLALGLATGVIGSVINQMGSMFGGGVIGAILFIIIFVFGHLLNIAINLLGAYVHTCRLQYVEFFGKFYDGGGRAFEPFNMKTKYVDFKEEK